MEIGGISSDASKINHYVGHVRVFDLQGSEWTQVGSTLNGTSTKDYFGYSLDMSNDGSILLIGSYGVGDAKEDGLYRGLGEGKGQVSIYEFQNNQWQLGSSFDGEKNGDQFGINVSLSGDGSTFISGADYNEGGGIFSGQIRVFYNTLLDISNHQVGTSYNLAYIKDYDGNLHANTGSVSDATKSAYKYQGLIDVNADGTKEAIYTNKESGRWVTASINSSTGEIDYSDHGQGGTTRVVGIYIDPLVQEGIVEQFGPHDSQRRFQNDLKIDNLIAKTSGDYDGDGFQEVYWKTNDGTAYLRSLMHADGNIQYANYQNEEQMSDYLTSKGYESVISEIIA